LGIEWDILADALPDVRIPSLPHSFLPRVIQQLARRVNAGEAGDLARIVKRLVDAAAAADLEDPAAGARHHLRPPVRNGILAASHLDKARDDMLVIPVLHAHLHAPSVTARRLTL